MLGQPQSAVAPGRPKAGVGTVADWLYRCTQSGTPVTGTIAL